MIEVVAVDISIFVPVYKESPQLAGLLNELVSQNVSKEIFVTVDAADRRVTQTIKALEQENCVKFIVNKERVGKANALNSTVKLSTGKVLLFLDFRREQSQTTLTTSENRYGNAAHSTS